MRRDTEIHVVNGEDVARRQLSQWQCKVQFGVPSYWNVIEPHRHLPSTAFKSGASPFDESCDVAARRIRCQCQSARASITLAQLNGRPILQAYGHLDARAMVAATGGTLFLVVGPSGVGKDALIRAVHPRLVPHGFVFPRRWITTPDDRGEDHIPVSCADFDEAIARGFIDLNWSAHGLRYGIPAVIGDDLSAGLHVIINVSRLLIQEARARFPRVRVVHLTASQDLVRSRLLQRAREDAAAIEERMQRSAPFPADQGDVVLFSNHLPLSESADRLSPTILAARRC